MIKRFTGWHMLMLMIGFFAIVIGVNFYMARMALSSFGGTVVDNSYVASQKFNTWLDTAKRQEQAGWSLKLSLDQDRYIRAALYKHGVAARVTKITGTATHPLGRTPAQPLMFAISGTHDQRSLAALPDGRWSVAVVLESGSETLKFMETVQ
jgi:nitrogen fixation protein FixH